MISQYSQPMSSYFSIKITPASRAATFDSLPVVDFDCLFLVLQAFRL